jgi:hypothetical protein
MRVTINGSGAILTHGDGLSGGGVIEFPVNEPPEFDDTLAAYTVTGSAPSRKLRFQGHEIAVETPTSTAERVPDTGSGITNGADDGQIAVSDGTNIIGSADLTWDQGAHTLGIDGTVNGHAVVKAVGVGAELSIRAADADANVSPPLGSPATTGGEIEIVSGAGDGGSGGAITVGTGTGTGGGDSGSILIKTGPAPTGQSGDIEIRVDPAAGSAHGGRVVIAGGQGDTSSGGNVILQAGTALTGGSHGAVQFYSGDGNTSVDIGNLGFYVLGPIVVLDGLPTADPTNAGQLWNDAGTLKVSAG